MRTVIALDIGATSIKAAAIDSEGRVLTRASAPTEGAKGPNRVLENAAALVDRMQNECGNEGLSLGVSSCGSIDPATGVVVEATIVMPDWPGTDIKSFMEKRARLKTAVRNDGEAAALGEAVYGAGKGVKVFAMLTLGTGVGGGLVFNGEIFGGETNLAGKIGHMKAVQDGRDCSCGARGCLEAYASAYACRAAFGKEPLEVFSMAVKGDEKAAAFVCEAGTALGRVCADLCNCLNPGMIAIGGGMAEGWELLYPHVMMEFEKCAMQETAKAVKIHKAVCGNDAGVLGAAALAMKL